ncbi:MULTISPECIES: helix-turn-helix domain-containing protein [Myroides]|uniref:helix-turn-helix domain-containing protein n=1 Tax=Myroides TaxID=76831 RepID=UPI0009136B7A|nr:AraC family transcriptional regulator [Myroides odoratimimus]SHL91962.1 AraC-type DNA-binding protein [Myroides odoratimimus subsp. xuanwuensis]
MSLLYQQYQEVLKNIPNRIEWGNGEQYKERYGQFTFKGIPIKQKFIDHPYFIISYGEWSVPTPVDVAVINEKSTFKLMLELEGYSCYSTARETIEVPQDCFNLLYVPRVNGHLKYKTNRKVVEVLFDEDYFAQLVETKIPALASFLNLVKQGKTTTLFAKAKTIPVEIHQLLLNILQSDVHPDLKQVYLETKVTELLLLSVQESLERKVAPIEEIKSMNDADKLLHIKTWIDNHFLQDITFSMLSQRFYINEYKLKKYFKKYYDSSLIRYVRDLRFEYAYQLLSSQKFSVNKVAELLHYEYPQHFAIAFKKKYGVPPSTLIHRK